MNDREESSVCCGCTPVVDAEHDFESDRPATETISCALADAVRVDPAVLPPLFDCVDPDARNVLFTPHDRLTDSDTLLSFRVNTWEEFVRSDGRIRICDATHPTDPEPVFESAPANT